VCGIVGCAQVTRSTLELAMPSEFFFTTLIVQCSATLFLFAVFLVLFKHSRKAYFGYWTAAWFALGTGLAALQMHLLIAKEPGDMWGLVALYHSSLGVTALLALFARYAFVSGKPVARRMWLLFVVIGAQVVMGGAGDAQSDPIISVPGHLLLAYSLWASSSLFWRLARTTRRPGAGFLAASFGLWGLLQLHHAGAGMLFRETRPLYLDWIGFVGTAFCMCVAMGMILFSLDEDRFRLVESNRKLEISEQRLKDLAMRDPLTGLFNRRHFDTVVPQLEAQARRLRFPITLFAVDLNNFKETNDREGHHRGDQVLYAVADFLRTEKRESDLAFRWGGDEFLLVMTDLSSVHAEEKANELRARWEKVRAEIKTDVTLAVGWAPLVSQGVEAALRLADRRMYGDKRAFHAGPGGEGRHHASAYAVLEMPAAEAKTESTPDDASHPVPADDARRVSA
jgi:diguanylate cyclase (GGDEF)-like protein